MGRGERYRSVLGILVAALGLALASGSGTAAAQAPYEPNDSLAGAAGPLATGQTYAATLETSSDKDFFYFYVTSIGAEVSLTVKNLGGGSPASEIDVRIVDSSGTFADGYVAYLPKGAEGTATASLPAGKYFVEVGTIAFNDGRGDDYVLTAGGSEGAFGDYGQIAANCGSATASVRRLRAGLKKAKAKLLRATGRLRRSLYSSPEVREDARSDRQKAKVRAAAKRKALLAAIASRRPWCLIPQ